MSLRDKMDAIYNKQMQAQKDPDEFKAVAETMFKYVSEKLIAKAQSGAYDRTGLFGGGRPYVRTDVFVTSSPSFPKDHVKIDNPNTVIVNSFQKEGKKLYRELKNLAAREGVKCFTGNGNIGFEYYMKG